MTIDISEYKLIKRSADLLKILLKDRTTKKNIVWATHSYELLGNGFSSREPITLSKLTGIYVNLIQPRAEKSDTEQKKRTKIRAEIFTPVWLVEKQNSYIEVEIKPLALKDYVQMRWLEIACGEAPYMATRYDAVTGEEIPLSERVGFVDRKLQRISREISDEALFYEFVKEAYRASYGYEYQGDSLLLARENLLATFEDYYLSKTGNHPTLEQKKEIATIISYNVFQMDGLKKISPYSAKQNSSQQLSLFSDDLEVEKVEELKTQIKDWKKNKMIGFDRLSREESEMKFDVVIGNPPYQEEAQGTSTKDMPIYHKFISESYKISKKASLITPARFLSNAGGTPKTWNQQMLNNKHVKVSFFEQKSGNVFPGTDIKGGVAVTYYDTEQEFEPIEVFVPFIEMDSIRKKVIKKNFESIDQFVTNRGSYRYSDLIYRDFPNLMERVSDRRIASNAFEKLPELFFDVKPEDGNEYIKIYGRFNNERVYKWFRKDYVTYPSNFEKYKIILPKANGSGSIGEVLSTPVIGYPVIGYPVIGYTETFISVGEFDSLEEAEACLKYIKSKFLRTMLGVLKITQDNTKAVWHYIPLQDFTVNSDIDWKQSVTDIDRQLYQKYDFSPEEIAFIETHVREMN